MNWDEDRRAYYEQQAAEEEYIEEISIQAVNEFTSERLQSYFLTYPEVAKEAYFALDEAIRLKKSDFFSAAFLFSVIATEVAVKSVLLKPIVNGLVHNIPTSTLITDLVVRNGLDRIEELLCTSLNNIANIDLKSFTRDSSGQNLWSEIKTLQKKRDYLVHRAKMPSQTDAEQAISVADAVLVNLFPAVIEAIGLHLHEGRICNGYSCPR